MLGRTLGSGTATLDVSALALGREADAHAALTDVRAAAATSKEAMEVHARAVELSPRFADEHDLWVERHRAAALLAGDRAPEGADDHLALAWSLYQRKEFPRSAESFERAVADAALRADLDRVGLYNGACAAALASAALAGDVAAHWRRRAFEWLAADLHLRRGRVAATAAELAGSPDAKRRATLEATLAADRTQLEWARTGDSDLAPLRGSPEFDALFPNAPSKR